MQTRMVTSSKGENVMTPLKVAGDEYLHVMLPQTLTNASHCVLCDDVENLRKVVYSHRHEGSQDLLNPSTFGVYSSPTRLNELFLVIV